MNIYLFRESKTRNVQCWKEIINCCERGSCPLKEKIKERMVHPLSLSPPPALPVLFSVIYILMQSSQMQINHLIFVFSISRYA